MQDIGGVKIKKVIVYKNIDELKRKFRDERLFMDEENDHC